MKGGLSLGDIPSDLEQDDSNEGPFTQVDGKGKGRGKRSKETQPNVGTSIETGTTVNNSANTGIVNTASESVSNLNNASSDEVLQRELRLLI